MAKWMISVFAHPGEEDAIRRALRDERVGGALREEVVEKWAEKVINDLNARFGEGGRVVKFVVGKDVRDAVYSLTATAARRYGGRRALKVVLLSLASELGYYQPMGKRLIPLRLTLPAGEMRALSGLSPLRRSELVAYALGRLGEAASRCDLSGRRDITTGVLRFTEDVAEALEGKAKGLGLPVSCVVHLALGSLDVIV